MQFPKGEGIMHRIGAEKSPKFPLKWTDHETDFSEHMSSLVHFLQKELTLQQPLGCLPNQLWEPCGCLRLSWYLCKTVLKSGLLLSPPKPVFVRASFGELPMRSYGTAIGWRTCLSPAMRLTLTSHRSHWCSPKATPGVCQDQDGEKGLGIWPVITVTTK